MSSYIYAYEIFYSELGLVRYLNKYDINKSEIITIQYTNENNILLVYLKYE